MSKSVTTEERPVKSYRVTVAAIGQLRKDQVVTEDQFRADGANVDRLLDLGAVAEIHGPVPPSPPTPPEPAKPDGWGPFSRPGEHRPGLVREVDGGKLIRGNDGRLREVRG
jgi:hypothetical protein